MYLNLIELAESLGVEERTVESWIRNEGLPCVHDRGRLLFDRAEVAAWAASRGLAAKAGFLAKSPAGGEGVEVDLGVLLRRGGIWRDVASADVLDVLAKVLERLPGASVAVRQLLAGRLRQAGAMTWAPVGGGLALPHLRAPAALGRDSGLVAVVLLRDVLSVAEELPDAEPVRRLAFFVAPTPRTHLELLARLTRWIARGPIGALLVQGASDEAIHAALARGGVLEEKVNP